MMKREGKPEKTGDAKPQSRDARTARKSDEDDTSDHSAAERGLSG